MSKTKKKSPQPQRERPMVEPKREAAAEPIDAQASIWQVEYLQERLAELELALEDQGWQLLIGESPGEFSREALTKICQLARLNWVKNPLIKRGVAVQSHYVFGQGVSVRAEDEAVNDVVQAFMDDAKNQAELTTHQALLIKEQELSVFANLFFVFFVDKASGRVRVRTIPMDEVSDIVCDPEDAKSPWFYRRAWAEKQLDGMAKTRTAYYPDWRYVPKVKPSGIGSVDVLWDTPVYHVKTNCLSDMKFGISEVYAALDWAKAYKSFLENWATIVQAYARFAWQLTAKGGKTGIAAAKTKLQTTVGSSSSETNPPPVTGATFISGGEGVNMQPIRTAGATTSAEDGRRLLLMVAAATGLPESFFGDVSVGTLATAKSLDRPTELMMRNRQMLWASVLQNILRYVIEASVRATGGKLQGDVEDDDDGVPVITLRPVENPETGEMEEPDITVNITFPPILEHDVAANVSAIVQAATLGGAGIEAGTIDKETVSRLLLTALGVQDVDAVMEVIYPPEGEQETKPAAESQMVEAVKELRGAIAQFVERKCK